MSVKPEKEVLNTSTGKFGICLFCTLTVEMTRPDPKGHLVMRSHSTLGKRCEGSGKESTAELKATPDKLPWQVKYV